LARKSIGVIISATETERLRLVNKAAPEAELEEATTELANKLAAKGRWRYALEKKESMRCKLYHQVIDYMGTNFL